MQGFLFDVYPDNEKNLMVYWILSKKGPLRFERQFKPNLYVSGTNSLLHSLKQELNDVNAIE